MKSHSATKNKITPAVLHRNIVDRVVADAKPARLLIRPGAQWVLWLLSSGAMMAFFWMKMGVQNNLGQTLQAMPPLLFILTAFAGASLAAWEAIASSVPGRQTSSMYQTLAILVIVALFSIPFLFFTHPAQWDLFKSFADGHGCAEGVAFSGLIPWVFIGWMLSRNASFRPVWTGLWSGVSAFLMGTITIQIHCPSWDMDHVLMTHLLPTAAGTLLAALLGSFWFSSWKK
jgi:hypothetical protein